LDTELLADSPGADVLMASDPMYYQRLKAKGALAPYASLRALQLDRKWVDRDGAFVACRLSVMGIAHRDDVGAPHSWAALLGMSGQKITLPEPLGSGTMLATLVALERRLPMVEGLFKLGAVSSGGGTAVIDRLQRNEAGIGIALYENVALSAGGVGFTVPDDGAVIIPGMLAVLTRSKRLTLAKAVYDLMLGEKAQAIFRAHALRSPFDANDDLMSPLVVWDEDPTFVAQTRERWSKRFKEAR